MFMVNISLYNAVIQTIATPPVMSKLITAATVVSLGGGLATYQAQQYLSKSFSADASLYTLFGQSLEVSVRHPAHDIGSLLCVRVCNAVLGAGLWLCRRQTMVPWLKLVVDRSRREFLKLEGQGDFLFVPCSLLHGDRMRWGVRHKLWHRRRRHGECHSQARRRCHSQPRCSTRGWVGAVSALKGGHAVALPAPRPLESH